VELVQRVLLCEDNQIGLAEGVHALREWLAQDALRWCEALRDWQRLDERPHGVYRPLF
jgi:hypothetical protein